MNNSANCIFCPINLSICSCQRTLRASPQAPSPPVRRGKSFYQVVGVTGFEPVTLRLSSACSNQLSYTPVYLVELRRVELLTYSLQSYRSTN